MKHKEVSDCFAYDSNHHACRVCRELICASRDRRCPFYKTAPELRAAQEKSNRRLAAIGAAINVDANKKGEET